MEGTPLLPLPEGMLIEQIQLTETGLRIAVIATHPTSRCPLCSELSSSIHSRYSRILRDVPCGGRQVQLVLTVRKFFCRNALCPRKVFDSTNTPVCGADAARMTIRLCQSLQSISRASCGKGGAKLAARLGMHTSRYTILRRIMDLPDASPGSVVYLGIDDFSFRRGYRFGTICVDLEGHRVVDILPDRRAETAARWMFHQPDVMVVSRDRGGEYASAAALGAPQAIQCADRFHVLKNLTEAVQVLVARCQSEILAACEAERHDQEQQEKPVLSLAEWRPKEPAHVEKVRLARRAGRYARYQQVRELYTQGKKPKEIAHQLGLSDRTVHRWLASGTFPEARKRRKRQSCFEVFAPYVLKRWQDGERKGIHLFREIREQGYTGSARSVYRYVETLKQAEVRMSVNPARIRKYSANTAVWLFMRDPNTLDEGEQEDLTAFCQVSPALSRAYTLIRDFQDILHRREGHRLDAWLAKVRESGLPELQSFVSGIEKDKAAVRAGLTWPINNGMVEGFVTKLKLIKRQMYGKAGFALLRQRVLHAL